MFDSLCLFLKSEAKHCDMLRDHHFGRAYNVTESNREEMKPQVFKRIKVVNNGRDCRKIEFANQNAMSKN